MEHCVGQVFRIATIYDRLPWIWAQSHLQHEVEETEEVRADHELSMARFAQSAKGMGQNLGLLRSVKDTQHIPRCTILERIGTFIHPHKLLVLILG